MPESGEQGNSKGTSGKHLGVEEMAAFLLSTLWVLVWCHGRAQSSSQKNGRLRTWAEEGQTEISRKSERPT